MTNPTEALDHMFNAFAKDGWDGIAAVQAKAREMASAENEQGQAARQRELDIIARVFGSPDGAALLQLLVKKTIWRSASVDEREAKTVEQYALAKAKREGQNDVVFMILAMLRAAHGHEPQQGGTEL